MHRDLRWAVFLVWYFKLESQPGREPPEALPHRLSRASPRSPVSGLGPLLGVPAPSDFP